MSEVFPNAPLVELAVELRWDVDVSSLASPTESLDAFANVNFEEAFEPFYKSALGGLANEGFVQSERVIPRGLPTPPHQATYRCTQVGDSPTVVYHFGPGVFSVNAIPPYRSWDDFRPNVETGLRVLLGSWAQPEGTEFNRIALRYIDAFSDEFTEGATRFDFMTHVLGFDLKLPGAVNKLVATGAQPDAFIQFSLPMADGSEMAIRTGEATVNNAQAVVLDIAVLRKLSTPGNMEEVMKVLDSAHKVINASFVEMTHPVSHVLKGELA